MSECQSRKLTGQEYAALLLKLLTMKNYTVTELADILHIPREDFKITIQKVIHDLL